jgi:hypothetical protein
MYLAGQKEESGNVSLHTVLRAFFLTLVIILVLNRDICGQTTNAQKNNQNKPHKEAVITVETAPMSKQGDKTVSEVNKADQQSVLQRYADKIKRSSALRRKLLLSSALFLLLLLLLIFAVRGLIRELRQDEEVSARAEITRHSIASISIGPYVFFIGNCEEGGPNAVQPRPKALRPYVE